MRLSSFLLYMLLHEYLMCMTKLSSYFKVGMKQKSFLLYCDVYPYKPASQTGNSLGQGLILSIENWLNHLIVVCCHCKRKWEVILIKDYEDTCFFLWCEGINHNKYCNIKKYFMVSLSSLWWPVNMNFYHRKRKWSWTQALKLAVCSYQISHSEQASWWLIRF